MFRDSILELIEAKPVRDNEVWTVRVLGQIVICHLFIVRTIVAICAFILGFASSHGLLERVPQRGCVQGQFRNLRKLKTRCAVSRLRLGGGSPNKLFETPYLSPY